MTCCNNNVKELLNTCCDGDCEGDTICAPLFDIASPVDGQLLIYSEEFKSVINKNPDTLTLRSQTVNPTNMVDGLIFIKNNELCVQLSGVIYKVSVTPL